MIDPQIQSDELVLKFFTHTLSDEEKQTLRKTIKESKEERANFEELLFVYEATEAIRLNESQRMNQAWSKIKAKRKLSLFSDYRQILIKAAAILTIPLLISTLYFYYKSRSVDDTISLNQVSCLNSDRTKIYLPDGSIAYLHKGSTLRYPNKFNKNERLVELQGEGFFEVESDKKHPFYVQTYDGSKVMAYGTAFSVCAYKNNNVMTVFLARGLVDFTSPNVKKKTSLQPGVELTYNRSSNTVSTEKKNIKECIDWVDGKMVFSNTPMEEVASKLSKHFNVDIRIKDKQLNQYFFNATFKEENLQQILYMLKISSPKLDWEVQNENTSSNKKQIIILKMAKK